MKAFQHFDILASATLYQNFHQQCTITPLTLFPCFFVYNLDCTFKLWMCRQSSFVVGIPDLFVHWRNQKAYIHTQMALHLLVVGLSNSSWRWTELAKRPWSGHWSKYHLKFDVRGHCHQGCCAVIAKENIWI